MKRAIQFIYSNLDHLRGAFWFCAIASAIDGIVKFMIPVLLAEFTKSELTLEAFHRLIPYLLACFVASLCLQWIIRAKGEALSYKYAVYLRKKYYGLVQGLRVEKLVQVHTGYLLSLITKVCDGACNEVFAFIWLIARGVSTLLVFFYFTAQESVFIAVLNLAVLILFVCVSVLLSLKMVPIAKTLNLKNARLIESFVDLVANIVTVKKLGLYRFAEGQLESKVDDNYQQIDALQLFHANRWFVLHAIYGIAFLSTISYLLYGITNQTIPASVLILFISAYATIQAYVERFSEMVKNMLELGAYVHSIDEVLDDMEPLNGECLESSFSEVIATNVVCQYKDTDKKIVIPHFQLTKGEIVCITGESGQGKSTFLNVLSSLIEPSEGELSLNNQSYSDLSKGFFRELFAVVSQEVELFNLSVRENLLLGKEIDEARIVQVLQALNLESWYRDLPEGLDTVVGEKGVRLSSGQKQRLNIARGVLLDREILLFDEPTSHLDEQTELQVIDFLQKELRNKTAVFVTHRPALEEICTKKYIFTNSVLIDATTYASTDQLSPSRIAPQVSLK